MFSTYQTKNNLHTALRLASNRGVPTTRLKIPEVGPSHKTIKCVNMRNADNISWMGHSNNTARGGSHGRRLLYLHLPCEHALVAIKKMRDHDGQLTNVIRSIDLQQHPTSSTSYAKQETWSRGDKRNHSVRQELWAQRDQTLACHTIL